MPRLPNPVCISMRCRIRMRCRIMMGCRILMEYCILMGCRFLPAVNHPLTTIRTPSKVISGPFWPAESNCDIGLSIDLPDVTVVATGTSPKFESSNIEQIPPTLLHPSVQHHQPTVRKATQVFPNLFDVLNGTVISVCLWLWWLWSCKQKHSKVENSGQYFHPSINHHQPTVRKATQGVSEPIRCAESNCDLHLSMAVMVVELQAETFQGGKFRPIFSSINKALPPTVRKATQSVSKPIRAKSSYSIHLLIAWLVAEL